MIIKFLKNELIKMTHSKRNYVLIGCLIFMILSIVYITFMNQKNIINNMPQIQNLSEERKQDILNMNTAAYLRLFATEFVFRPIVPYFIFFMVVFSVELFGTDLFSGNMKFFMNIDKKGINIFIAKVLSLFVYALFIVALNIILGFVLSSLFFSVSFNGLFRIIIIYLSSIIPVVTFSLIIGLISMYIQNKKVSLVIGISSSILLTVVDRITNTRNFSPIGILGIMDNIRPLNIHLSQLCISNMVSIIYLIVFYFIGVYIFKNREFNY
ncbi:hypothetical protein [Clostridium taeniosporum]|uniref:Uncharacterized protein n=1 Tax=Clostridium taeniosporum TaxID=394958 RepID=A0A1D7XNU6_9CLOT|nr:hypothetical protein [Clostridium taeniosporum]AOR25013.1 hypothetical protein BGI42_14800 [Clostridium taeniosporum]